MRMVQFIMTRTKRKEIKKGCYFNPPNKLPSVGRKLEIGDFAALTGQLLEGEILAGYWKRMDRPYENAVHLSDEREFAEFHRQQLEGLLVHKGFFAVKRDVWESSGGQRIF